MKDRLTYVRRIVREHRVTSYRHDHTSKTCDRSKDSDDDRRGSIRNQEADGDQSDETEDDQGLIDDIDDLQDRMFEKR